MVQLVFVGYIHDYASTAVSVERILKDSLINYKQGQLQVIDQVQEFGHCCGLVERDDWRRLSSDLATNIRQLVAIPS